MKLRFERVIPSAVGRRQRLIEDHKGAIGITRPRLGLGQSDLQQPVEKQTILLPEQLCAPAHVAEALAKRIPFGGRQTLEKRPDRLPIRQIMLTCKASDLGSVLRGARPVASHQFEPGRVVFHICVGAHMRDARDPLVRVLNKGNRAPDVSQRP